VLNLFVVVLITNKSTNKVIVDYMTVIKQFLHNLLDFQKLTDLKFISQVKYLCHLAFLYFLKVDEYASMLTKD
jgi:hypothetical protein